MKETNPSRSADLPAAPFVPEGDESTAPTPPISRPENVPLLDALRGLCAFAVFVSHDQPPGLPRVSGAVFVDIFMVISGFLMTHHYILRERREPWNSPATVGMFYLRRFFRIAPLYYVGLAIFFIFFANEAQGQRVSVTWNVIQHATFFYGFIQSPGFTHMPDWSLALEMQFYLAFPFLMLWVARQGPVPLVVTSAVIAWAANRVWGLYAGPPGPWGTYIQPSILPLKFTLFTLGILTAYVYWKRATIPWPILALLALAGALPYRHGHPWFVISVLGLALTASQAPGIKTLARTGIRKLNHFCQNRLFHYMAEYSYALYLTHAFVISWVSALLSRHLQGYGPLLRWALILTACVPVAYGLAFLFQQAVEKPGISIGRRLCRMVARTPIRPGATSA